MNNIQNDADGTMEIICSGRKKEKQCFFFLMKKKKKEILEITLCTNISIIRVPEREE